MPSTHRLDTALRHGVSHRIHYSPRNAPKSGSILKPYTRRTSAHRPPSSMRLRPRLWPFVFAPQSAQVPPCPVSVQCAVACARAARCSPPSPLARTCHVPWLAQVSPAPPSAPPPSYATCAVALDCASLGVAALSRRVPLRLTAPFVVDAVAQDAHTCRTKDVAESVEA